MSGILTTLTTEKKAMDTEPLRFGQSVMFSGKMIEGEWRNAVRRTIPVTVMMRRRGVVTGWGYNNMTPKIKHTSEPFTRDKHDRYMVQPAGGGAPFFAFGHELRAPA